MLTQFRTDQTLLFIGDSITDCNRREPATAPLGNGYVKLFADLLTVREPTQRPTILNRGVSGNTVEDLRSRWHDDVLTLRPDWLSIKIGINDISWYLSDPKFAGLSPAGYRGYYDQLLAATRAQLPNCHILLISPFLLSTDRTSGSFRAKMLDILPEYVGAIGTLATHYDAQFLDLHALFQARLQIHHPDVYCLEPIHPNPTGHLFIAEAVYSALSS